MTTDLSHILDNARVAANKLNLIDDATIARVLCAVADEADRQVDYIGRPAGRLHPAGKPPRPGTDARE